jgi:uncharacterized integral membrane protein
MRATTWMIAVPAVLAAIWIALANRAPVTLSLDPFSADLPAVAVQLPLYLLIFLSILLGVLLTGLVLFIRRAMHHGARLAGAAQNKATALLPERLRKTKNAPP